MLHGPALPADVSWRDPRPRARAGSPQSIAVATAILVAAPVVSIIVLAMQPAPDVWQTLIQYVLPRSLLDTALLLIGVGSLSLAIGTGAAWAVIPA